MKPKVKSLKDNTNQALIISQSLFKIQMNALPSFTKPLYSDIKITSKKVSSLAQRPRTNYIPCGSSVLGIKHRLFFISRFLEIQGTEQFTIKISPLYVVLK